MKMSGCTIDLKDAAEWAESEKWELFDCLRLDNCKLILPQVINPDKCRGVLKQILNNTKIVYVK